MTIDWVEAGSEGGFLRPTNNKHNIASAKPLRAEERPVQLVLYLMNPQRSNMAARRGARPLVVGSGNRTGRASLEVPPADPPTLMLPQRLINAASEEWSSYGQVERLVGGPIT